MKLRNRLRSQDGFALIVALIVLSLFMIIGAAVIDFSSANERDSARSRSRVQTHANAEGGIAAGLSRIFKVVSQPTAYAGGPLNPSILPGSRIAAVAEAGQPVQYSNGYAYYWGTLATLTNGCQTVTRPDTGQPYTPASCGEWTITSEAHERNPNPGGSDIVRVVLTKFQVASINVVTTTSTTWDWIYSRHTGSTCDMTVQNPGEVSTNVYAEGNLCVENTAVILGDPNAPGDASIGLPPGRQLVVKRNLTLRNPGNGIGKPAQGAAPAVYVGVHLGINNNAADTSNGYCKWKNQSSYKPCHGPASNGRGQYSDNMYSTSLDSIPPPVAFPAADWNYAYVNASPGPGFPCTVATGTPPTFDNDTVMNRSVGTVDLTPTTAYTCKTAAGEISWTPQVGNTPGTLVIRGVIFVDGSLNISNGRFVDYDGQAVIYASGRITMSNGSVTCAVFSSSGYGGPNPTCNNNFPTDPNGWNPDTNLLLFVSNAPQSLTSPPIQLTGAQFQGGLWADYNIEIGGTSKMAGPIQGDYMIVGQTGGTNFPPITLVPAGSPGAQYIVAAATTPKIYG
jgi:hypothetical protein